MEPPTIAPRPSWAPDDGPAAKWIKGPMDLAAWKRSLAHRDYLDFLHRVNDAVAGKKTSQWVPQSPGVQKVMSMLEVIKGYTDKHPPEAEMQQRYGNKAYRKWYAELTENAKELINDVLEEVENDGAAAMLEPYLLDSFGNQTRIDYGSGHEAAFIILLLCFEKIGLFTPEDLPAVGLMIFGEYLRACRHLQRLYKMEPAGSHGVYSLDDYQFVPFLWGSSQLIGSNFDPNNYPQPEKVQDHDMESLFLEAITYINDTKTGPFYEHSNQLWNISAVPNWDKINSGLFKMYEAEVLLKFPVVQHFLFCKYFQLTPVPDEN
ncbi:unnamed protein product, partial [Mesorhabditis spiculigera]